MSKGFEWDLQLFAEDGQAGERAAPPGAPAVPSGDAAPSPAPVPGNTPEGSNPPPAAAEQNPAKEAEINLTEAYAEAKTTFNPQQAGEIGSVLKEAGVKDNAVANKLAAWVLTQQQRMETELLDETLKEFGGTKDNPGEKLKEARLKAGRAMEALEKKAPGLREALRQSPLDYDVRVLKALAAVGEMAGEDGNFMGGAASEGASVASLYFPKK
jgi:hypothetical protein